MCYIVAKVCPICQRNEQLMAGNGVTVCVHCDQPHADCPTCNSRAFSAYPGTGPQTDGWEWMSPYQPD